MYVNSVQRSVLGLHTQNGYSAFLYPLPSACSRLSIKLESKIQPSFSLQARGLQAIKPGRGFHAGGPRTESCGRNEMQMQMQRLQVQFPGAFDRALLRTPKGSRYKYKNTSNTLL